MILFRPCLPPPCGDSHQGLASSSSISSSSSSPSCSSCSAANDGAPLESPRRPAPFRRVSAAGVRRCFTQRTEGHREGRRRCCVYVPSHGGGKAAAETHTHMRARAACIAVSAARESRRARQRALRLKAKGIRFRADGRTDGRRERTEPELVRADLSRTRTQTFPPSFEATDV